MTEPALKGCRPGLPIEDRQSRVTVSGASDACLRHWAIVKGVEAFQALATLRNIYTSKFQSDGKEYRLDPDVFEEWFKQLNTSLVSDLLGADFDGPKSCMIMNDFWLKYITDKPDPHTEYSK